VQDTLESALALFAGQPVATVCAGRTDTGVHAVQQIVHLDAPVQRSDQAWVRGVNAHLPSSIAIRWAQPVPPTFHARFSARARAYVYILVDDPVRPPAWVGRAGWSFRPLDADAMQQGAQYLLGEHDFSAFRSSQCQAASPVRTMHSLDIERRGRFIIFTLRANAFLHHMVRNIVGALVYVGQGRQPPQWMAQLLQERDRTRSAPTFSPDGLYLTSVAYPAEFGLPATDFTDEVRLMR
jgi:tRNA pseudouridine38-40 synthase